VPKQPQKMSPALAAEGRLGRPYHPVRSRENKETSPKSVILCEASKYVARFCATNIEDASRIAWPEQVASRRRAEWRPAFPFSSRANQETSPKSVILSEAGCPIQARRWLEWAGRPLSCRPPEPSLRAGCPIQARRWLEWAGRPLSCRPP